MESDKKPDFGIVGLLGFAVATVLSSLDTFDVYSNNHFNLLAIGLVFGGLMQVVSGLIIAHKNQEFLGLLLTLFGCYWLQATLYRFMIYSALYLNTADVSGYQDTEATITLFFSVITALFIVNQDKTDYLGVTTLTSVVIFTLLRSIGLFADSLRTVKAGGVFGVLASFLAFVSAARRIIRIENETNKDISPV